MTGDPSEPLRTAEAGGAAAAATAMTRDPLYLRGVVLVMLAGSCWSLGGLLIRLAESADAWLILFYRSISVAAFLFCLLALRYRGGVLGRFRAAGWPAAAGGLCLALAFIGWVFSVLNTTVANAVFILSAAPFASAVLAWLVLKERVQRATWFAMVAALAGIAVMVAGGIGAGAAFGNLMALLAMLGFSGFAVALRVGRSGDMMPAVCYAGLFAAVISAGLAGGFAVSGTDLGLFIAMGVGQIGVGMVLFTQGSRSVPAAELALLSLTEVILGPLWVWLAMAEVPSVPTLVGGAIVLLAIAGRAAGGLRRKPPPLGAV